MESPLVVVNLCTALHQFFHLYAQHFGHQAVVDIGRDHYLHSHAALQCAPHGSPHGTGSRGIGIDDAHPFAGRIQRSHECAPHLPTQSARFPIDHNHALVAFRLKGCMVAQGIECLARNTPPDTCKYPFKLIDDRSFEPHLHVAPLARPFRSVEIIVGHVHAPGVGHTPVHDHNLPVVAMKEVPDVGKTYRVEQADADAQRADAVELCPLHGVRCLVIAIGINEQSHLHPLTGFLVQETDESSAHGVVTENEIFEMDEVLCLADGAEHVVELLPRRREQGDFVALVFRIPLSEQYGPQFFARRLCIEGGYMEMEKEDTHTTKKANATANLSFSHPSSSLPLAPCTLHLSPCTLHLAPCPLLLAPCTLPPLATLPHS